MGHSMKRSVKITAAQTPKWSEVVHSSAESHDKKGSYGQKQNWGVDQRHNSRSFCAKFWASGCLIIN